MESLALQRCFAIDQAYSFRELKFSLSMPGHHGRRACAPSATRQDGRESPQGAQRLCNPAPSQNARPSLRRGCAAPRYLPDRPAVSPPDFLLPRPARGGGRMGCSHPVETILSSARSHPRASHHPTLLEGQRLGSWHMRRGGPVAKHLLRA